MEPDLLDRYQRAGDWTLARVAGAVSSLDGPTTCSDWDVRTLMNHMLDTQRYFADTAQGREASPPSPTPPALLTGDPAADFVAVQTRLLDAFRQPGVIERTGPSLGIAFSDQLLHGWDLAASTGQDTTMPAGLAHAAFELIHGRFSDDQRRGVFAPEIVVAPTAPAQDRLLAYTGRDPSSAI